MAQLEYNYPIEAVHGKLKGTFGAFKRKANAKGISKNCSVNYGKRNLTAKPYSTAEVTAHTTLGTISKMIAQRKASATQRVTDKQNFAAQSTYKTLQQYLYHLCAVQLAEQND